MDLELDESTKGDCATGAGVGGERMDWASGCPCISGHFFSKVNNEGSVNLEVPKFVSEMIGGNRIKKMQNE
jgi:hypothetical protein